MGRYLSFEGPGYEIVAGWEDRIGSEGRAASVLWTGLEVAEGY